MSGPLEVAFDMIDSYLQTEKKEEGLKIVGIYESSLSLKGDSSISPLSQSIIDSIKT